MSNVFPHSNKKGTEAALDLVEETLATLRKRVKEQQQQQHKWSTVKDVATNTIPPPPPPPSSITSSKTSKKSRNKSVLIKRKLNYKGKRTKHGNNSSVQENLGTQIFEEEPEKVSQDYCRHCNPRTEGGRSKAGKASQERRGITRPSPNDPKLPVARERIIWKHGKRGQRRKAESEDSFQGCLCHGNSCRPLYDDSDPQDVKGRVIWRKRVICSHDKRGHRRRKESEPSFQDCMCHCNTCITQRPARPLHDDSEPAGVRRQLERHGKRGHTRREESDSSCHSNTRKTHRRTKSNRKPKQTVQEDKRTDTRGKSRERQETREKCAGGQVSKHNEPFKSKKPPTHPRPPVDVDSQGYAQPTQTSRLRMDHSRPRKKEKENIMPYIPCGAKSHSYHRGIIAQQDIGHLMSQPLRENTNSKGQGSSSQREVVAATCLTQQTVRQAIANIHHHLKGNTEQ